VVLSRHAPVAKLAKKTYSTQLVAKGRGIKKLQKTGECSIGKKIGCGIARGVVPSHSRFPAICEVLLAYRVSTTRTEFACFIPKLVMTSASLIVSEKLISPCMRLTKSSLGK
jgi:hypothetical protein